jgi:GNAT superfamily N-acetyltransferase
VRTTPAPTKRDGNRRREPNGPEDAVCVPGSFSLIDRQGCEVLFRPLVPADRPTVASLFPGLSALTRFRRFNSLHANLSDQQLTSLFDLDYRDRFAWAVEIACDGMTAPVAVGRYARYAGTRRVDVAITIRDEWHGRGLGGSLLDTLIITAHHNGFIALQTIVTADNQAMLHLLRQRGAQLSAPTSGEVDAVLPLSGIIDRLTDHPLARMLTASTARASSRAPGEPATQFRSQWRPRNPARSTHLRSPKHPAVPRALSAEPSPHHDRRPGTPVADHDPADPPVRTDE